MGAGAGDDPTTMMITEQTEVEDEGINVISRAFSLHEYER